MASGFWFSRLATWLMLNYVLFSLLADFRSVINLAIGKFSPAMLMLNNMDMSL